MRITKIKLKGSPKAVNELAEKIAKICKAAKCEHKKGRMRRFAETSVSVKLNVYAVQELRKIKSKNVKIEVV